MASPVTSGSSSRVGSCPRSVQQSSGRASRSGSGSPLPQQQQQRGSTRSSLRLAAEVRDCSPCTDAEATTVDAAAAVSAAGPAATAATPEGGATVLEGDVAAVGASAADGAPPGRASGMATGAAPADTPATAGEKSRASVTPPTFQFVSSRLRAQAERQAAAAAAASTTSQQSTSSSSINSSRGSPSQSPYPGSALPSSSSPSSSSCSSSSSYREGGAGSSNSSSSSLYSSCGAATASRGGGGSGGRSGSSGNNNNRGVHLSTLWTGSSTSGRVGRRGGGMWCYICRDGVQRGEENVVECGACPKRFHLECLQQEGLLQPQQQQCGLSRGSGGGVVIQGEWLCPQCEEEQEEDEMQNDERCFICKKKEADSEDRLLLCDGCPNSYHMRSCLKMTIEPDEEKWFCPECNPAAFKRDEVRRLGRRGAPGVGGLRGSTAVEGRGGTAAALGSSGAYGSGGGNAAGPSECIVNASSCYVCQRPGKLLGCDFCPNSFHPACLVDVDWNSIGEEWECPVCRGQDPLANQMHKRWTRAEIEVKRKERSKCLLRIRAKTVRYRNRFLLVHQKDLGPFVHPKVWSNLAKSLRAQVGGSLQQTQQHSGAAQKRGAGAAGGGRLQVERSMADLLEGLEDEALEECAKFVKRAYRATRYPSGRKIEGVPLREGIELKPHQEEGVEWLLCSFMTGGGILADEMGLGKTIQTLCFLSYLNAMKLEGPHLIVVPLSTVGNWMREVHRFTPSLTHIKICGSRAERQHALDDRLAQRGLYDLYITTYETVKSEEEFFVEVIPHWQCIVLDEAHRIKNASGGIRHALDRVVGNMRLLLTGTPLQNSAAELFTLINFLMPDVFRDSQLIEQAFLSAQQQQQLLASGQALQPHTTSSQQQQQHGGARGGGGTARGGAGGGGAGGGGSSSSGAASSAACPTAQGSAAAGSAASSSAVASATANGAAGGSGGGGAAGGAGGGGSSSSNSGGGLEVEQLFRQEDLEKIRNLLDRVMLRRLKEQAIALPKKTFHSVWLPLSGTAAAWYERLLRIRALQEASKERLHESSYRKMLGLVIKMRIICAHPKALCARESQMQRLQALFVEEEAATQQEVMEAAQQLQQLEGEQHVRCSAKLCFLDKLLCHLHSLNCRFVPGYEREYDNHRREAATYKFYKQHEERVKEAVAAGRKPPRRPKRVELPGLPAFQLLLQKGDPRLAGVKAAADASYLEESMYAAELVMPVLPERPAAGAAAAVQVGGDEEEEEQQKQQRAAAGGREGKTAEADCETERDAGGAATGAARKIEREEQQLKKEGSTDVKQETGRSRKSPCYVNSGTAAATGTWGCPSSRGSGAGGVKLELATAGHEGGGKQQMKLQVGGAGGGITLLREKKALDKAAHAEPQTGGSAAAAAEARRTAATAAEAARAAALAIDEEEEEQLPRPIFSTKKKRGVVIVDDDEREKSCSPEAPDAAAAAALATAADHDGASVAAAPAAGTPTVLLSSAGAPAAPGGNGATHAEEQRELRDGVKQEEMQKQAAGGTAPPAATAAWAKEEEQQADEPGRKRSIDPSGRKQEAASQAKREEETEEREGQETKAQDGAPQKTENKEEGKKAISPCTEEARRDALQQKQQEDVLCGTTCGGSKTDELWSKSAAGPAAFPSLREAGGDVTATSGVSPVASGPSDAAAATAGVQQQKGKVPFEIDRSQPRLQRLLVFTQFQLVLDELESYCQFRGWKYLRLDGSTNKFVRELDIRDFNSETSTYFVYLISTRAGGLGINLTAANHVVLYDHDWNPFIDLQAVDRAHRIGQQREVHVWSLVNEWTVEERMAFRRDQKLRLDKLLVQHQQEESLEVEDEEKQQNRGEKISTDEIRRLMLHGRKAIMEVAAKRPIEIFDCSLEELASRQRLRLPELGSSGAAGGGALGSTGTADGEEGDAAAADATGDDARRREGDEEEEDGDSREETEDQELVDIDEVMNEEAEEQMKQQQLLEAADGMGPEENVDSSRSRDAGGGSSSGGTSQAESRTGATAAGGRTASAAGEAAGTAVQGGSGDAAEDAAAAGPEGKTAAATGAAAAGAAGTPGGAAEKSTGASCGAASPSTKGDLEKELQSAGVLWRSGRERKKPTAVYVPQEFGQREERKKIRHEQRCFICGQSRDFEQVVTDAEGKQHKIALGDLIPCSGCPRAYHRECEGLGKEVKKSWRCRWHECCLCFRKTSQCGNMLIHCARCPTSFCYDCFPPDYCRYNVGEEYYSQLRQRGMNVTPQNWILLLCSRCKAVEEQQTRRRLTKEEKEQEKQQQKELRQQQKELHEGLETKGRGGGGSGSSKDGAGGGGAGGAAGEGGGAAGGRHRAEEERRFFENKHKVDAIEAKQEEELRQAYQKLFPAAFTEELHKRVHAAKAAQKMNREASLAMQAQAAAAALAEGRKAAQEAAASVEDQQQKLHAAVAAAQQAAASAKKAQQQKRPVNQLVNMKLPAASLGLCDNCRLPCHGVKDYPGACCFPPEVVSKFFVRNSGGAGSALLPLRDAPAAAAGESPQQERQQNPDQKAGDGEGGSTSLEEQQQSGGSGSSGAKGTPVSAESQPTCNGAQGANSSGTGHAASAGEGDPAAAKKTLTPLAAAVGGGPLSPALKNLLASGEGATGAGISAATAAELAAAGIDSVKVVHKQVCGCCGECRTGKRSHLRKHCLSLSEEDKAKYAERRELVQQLIGWLLQQTPIPDTAAAGYSTASPQRLKGYYQQYQTQADRVVEEGMVAVGLGAAVAQRSFARRPYNTLAAGTPVLAARGGSAASVSMNGSGGQIPLQSPQQDGTSASNTNSKNPRAGGAAAGAAANGAAAGGEAAAAGASGSPTTGVGWSGQQKSRKRATHVTPPSSSSNSSNYGSASAAAAAGGSGSVGTGAGSVSGAKKRPTSCSGGNVLAAAAVGSSGPAAGGSESSGSHRRPSGSPRYGGGGRESGGISDVELLGVMHASQNASLHAQQHPAAKNAKALGTGGGSRRGQSGATPRAGGSAAAGTPRGAGGGQGTAGRTGTGGAFGDKGSGGPAAAGGREPATEDEIGANDKLLVTNPWNPTSSPVVLPAGGSAAMSSLLHAKDACALGVKLLQAAAASAAGPLMKGNFSAAAAAATAASLAAGMRAAAKRPADNSCKGPTTAKKIRAGSQSPAAAGAGAGNTESSMNAGARGSAARSVMGAGGGPASAAGPPAGGGAGGLEAAALLKRRKSPFPHTRDAYSSNNFVSSSSSGGLPPQNVPAAVESSGLHNAIGGGGNTAAPQPPPAPAPFKQQKSIIDFFLTKTKGGVPITSNSLSYAADSMRTNTAAPVGGPLAALAALVAARRATSGATSPPPASSGATMGGGYR